MGLMVVLLLLFGILQIAKFTITSVITGVIILTMVGYFSAILAEVLKEEK